MQAVEDVHCLQVVKGEAGLKVRHVLPRLRDLVVTHTVGRPHGIVSVVAKRVPRGLTAHDERQQSVCPGAHEQLRRTPQHHTEVPLVLFGFGRQEAGHVDDPVRHYTDRKSKNERNKGPAHRLLRILRHGRRAEHRCRKEVKEKGWYINMGIEKII